ncbi:YceD family protein [Paenibacillus turpanensis]|uniref:YceD family protein n=1 Tax=Paenibacillus turpanensis TaxID=2689078 RepID=UPI0014089783|nr:DUF177 domain-containing protein [Paenibacillus turpanensis]
MLIQFREMATKLAPVHIRERLDVTDAARGRKDLLTVAPLEVDLTATYKAGAIDVSGRLETTIVTACSRCLTQVTTKLEIPFEERFVQVEAGGGEQQDDGESQEEDDDIQRISGDKIDLQPYVLEYLQTELPLVSLCGDDCQGICPMCGKNRNDHPCECKEERIDPRLEGLKDFFKT